MVSITKRCRNMIKCFMVETSLDDNFFFIQFEHCKPMIHLFNNIAF